MVVQTPTIKRIEFFPRAVRNEKVSKETGKPKYDPLIFVNFIYSNGENFARPKYDIDEQKYPDEWAAFVANEGIIESGTPIAELHGIVVDEVATLKELGISTIEGLSASQLSSMQDLGERYVQLRSYATSFLKQREDMEELFSLKEKNAALELENMKLKGEAEKAKMAVKVKDPEAPKVVEEGDFESVQDPFEITKPVTRRGKPPMTVEVRDGR